MLTILAFQLAIMRRILKQYQNNGKALEVRLEEENGNKYHVILAGTTLKFRSGCASGRCDGGEDYLFNDNETYMAHSFPSYNLAEQAYETIKGKYIDYHWLENAKVTDAYAG